MNSIGYAPRVFCVMRAVAVIDLVRPLVVDHVLQHGAEPQRLVRSPARTRADRWIALA